MIESLDKEMILVLAAEICKETYLSEIHDESFENAFDYALTAAEEFHNRMTQAVVDFHSAKEQELKQQIENENKKAN